MKTLKFIISCAIAIITVMASCTKDFLDIENNDNIYRQSYVKDLGTMREFLNGIYMKIAVNLMFGAAQAYPEVIADNMRPATSTSPYLIPQYSWVQRIDANDKQESPGIDPEAKSVNAFWMTGYLTIRACSFVIDETDKYRKENPSVADDLKGQAYALRALIHFQLVNVYAQGYAFTSGAGHLGVPYITTPDISKPFSRNTVAEVYDGIISDYKKSIELLSPNVKDATNMNLLAAEALLARTYLFKNDYQEAGKLSQKIASQKNLMSIDQGYPDAAFKNLPISQTETLFQITPKGASPRTTFLGVQVTGANPSLVATSDIGTALNARPTDVRAKWAVLKNGNWVIGKFPTNSAPEVSPQPNNLAGAYYPAIIRMSEVYLTAAESLANTGDEVAARLYLNRVIKRADPSATDNSASGLALISSIQNERRKELAFEGLRMFDLQRWKLPVVRQDYLFGAKELSYGNIKAVAPIPSFDVELAKIPQNDGY